MKRFSNLCALLLLLLFSCKQETYYKVTTNAQPAEGGSVTMTPSSNPVLEGATVTFTAQSKGDYVFTGWSGGLTGTDNPKTITVSTDLSITANFTLRSYPLTLSVEGEGTVSENVISTKTDYSSGTVVELTAKAADHWLFDHWEGDLTGNESPAQITVSSSKTVKAVFVPKMYNLTVEVQGEGIVKETIIETKSSSFQEGTVVELTAQPGDHWVFDHWEGDFEGSENPAQITLLSPKTIKAVFEFDLDRHKGSFSPVTANDFVASIKLGANLAAILDGYDFSHQEGYKDDYYSTSGGKPKVQYYNEFNGRMNPEIATAMLDALKDVGVNAIRFPITFTPYMNRDNIIDEELLITAEKWVNLILDRGMYCIIEPHYDYGGWVWVDNAWCGVWIADQYRESVDRRYRRLWEQICERFKDYDEHLAFEAMNEPCSVWDEYVERYGCSWEDAHIQEARRVQDLNNIFYNTVRGSGGNNAMRNIMLSQHMQDPEYLNDINIPSGDEHVFMSVHVYTYNEHTEQWTWFSEWSPRKPSDVFRIEYKFLLVNDFKKRTGIPVIMGEFGTPSKLKDPDRAEYYRYVVNRGRVNGIPPFWFEYGYHYWEGPDADLSLYDRENMRWHYTDIINAINNEAYSDGPLLDFGLETDAILSFSEKEFKQYLVEKYDIDHDYELSTVEAWSIDKIEFYSSTIENLENLEKFIGLRELTFRGCKDWDSEQTRGKMKSLDLSGLNTIRWVDTSNQSLTALSLSQNEQLMGLDASNNFLESVNISDLPELVGFSFSENPLTSFSLSNCPKIREINLNNTWLSFSDLPDLTQWDLTSLHLSTVAHKMPSDFLRNFPNLTSLNICGNESESIDFSRNTLLEYLWCYDMRNVTVLDLSNVLNLHGLFMGGCPKLKTVYLAEGTQLQQLEKDDHTQVVYGHPDS